MKKISTILVVAALLSGCDISNLLEKIGLKERITNTIQVRNEIAYIPNTVEPFSGIYETFYLNGQKKQEKHYKHGKLIGLQTGWYENGQKEHEMN